MTTVTYFYDGQIRRYLLQIMRLMSNFVVKYSDGTLSRIPVSYGTADRQVSNIINQNSENTVQSTPRIAVYITDLELDSSRLSDSSYVGKVTVRERAINDITGEYLSSQGNGYTIERLMPTPYKLTVKVDIWSSSAGQKLEIIEQILMLFNPSLEIQTTDNYLDWTSLSVVDLQSFIFSSRSVPVGAADEIDIATLTLSTPIWISPPAKVKRMGVVTNIISNILTQASEPYGDYLSGLGVDPMANSKYADDLAAKTRVSTIPHDIEIDSGKVRLKGYSGNYPTWEQILAKFPNSYKPGLSKIFISRPNGSYIVGYFTVNPMNSLEISVNWDIDTYPSNTSLPSDYRSSHGTFDAIINPKITGPGAGLPLPSQGTRYLILEDIGGGHKNTFISEGRQQKINTEIDFNVVNGHRVFVDGVEVGSGSASDVTTGKYLIILDTLPQANSEIYYEVLVNANGPSAWKNKDGSDLIASENDIIEWSGDKWVTTFTAKQYKDSIIYLTNIYTGTQFEWNGTYWGRSFEGTYRKGEWHLEL